MTDTPTGTPPVARPDPPPPLQPDDARDREVEAIPRNVAALIAYHGWTDRQVYEAIGVGETGWLRRKSNPGLWTYQQIRRLARVLGVELSRLTRVDP